MATRNKIESGDVLRHGRVEFQMDRSVSIHWSDLFSKPSEDETTSFRFQHDTNGVLDLTCLAPLTLRNNTNNKFKEKFLPERIFIRPLLQTALKYRLANDENRTVVFGSPGGGQIRVCVLGGNRPGFHGES